MSKIRMLTLAVALMIVTGCARNPSTGRSQLILLSSDQVAAMGAEAAPQMVSEFGGEVASWELRSYVDRVGQNLLDELEPGYETIQWEFYVLDSEVINAFALPGGKVFMTRGLMSRFSNEAQLAGVLGHEIGHVTGRHVDERLSQTMIAQLGLAVLGSTTETAVIQQGAEIAAQGALLKFGRGQESESDGQGLKYMTKAGYDPHAMYEVLEILADAADGPRPPEMLSTHPNPRRRMQVVARALEGPYKYTQGSDDYGLYAGRYQRYALPYLR